MMWLGLLLVCLSLAAFRAIANACRQPANVRAPANVCAPTSAEPALDRHPEISARRVCPTLELRLSSSATTPADPKAAAFRVLFGADTAIHARNLIQHLKRPASR